MNDAGLTEYLINLIAHHNDTKLIGSSKTDLNDPDTSMSFEEFKAQEKIKYQCLDEAINLLIKLQDNSNIKIRDFILHLLKKKNRNVGFFHYLKDRLINGYIKTQNFEFQNLIYQNTYDMIYQTQIKTKQMYNSSNVLALIQML